MISIVLPGALVKNTYHCLARNWGFACNSHAFATGASFRALGAEGSCFIINHALTMNTIRDVVSHPTLKNIECD